MSYHRHVQQAYAQTVSKYVRSIPAEELEELAATNKSDLDFPVMRIRKENGRWNRNPQAT